MGSMGIIFAWINLSHTNKPKIPVTSLELKQALKAKTVEFETAMEAGQPHSELLKIYKELKELQYMIPYAEVSEIAERIEQ